MHLPQMQQPVVSINYIEPSYKGTRFQMVNYNKGIWQFKLYKIPKNNILSYQNFVGEVQKKYNLSQNQPTRKLIKCGYFESIFQSVDLYCQDSWSFAEANEIGEIGQYQILYEDYSKKNIFVFQNQKYYFIGDYQRQDWKWKQRILVQLHAGTTKVGETQFSSECGDWDIVIHEILTTQIEYDLLLKQLEQQCIHLRQTKSNRKIIPVANFGQALEISMIKTKNVEDFIVKKGIGKIQFFELIHYGGNQLYSVARDGSKFYIITHFWS